MTIQNPRQLIFESLQHSSKLEEAMMPHITHGAKEGTIQFLKEKVLPHFQLHAVQYEKLSGEHWLEVFTVVQDVDGQWEITTSSGGTIENQFSIPEKEKVAFAHRPWVGLSFHNPSTGPFAAEGCIVKNGFDVASVRLITSTGETLEDTVEHDLVLFLSERQFPGHAIVAIEVYNQAGDKIDTWQC